MRFTVAATVAGLAAVATADMPMGYGDKPMGYGGSMAPPANVTAAPSYTTEVVTQLTTYCPEATQITHGGQTYTVTEATTLTITNCPCTVTKPVYSSVVTSCSTCAPWSSPVAPVYSSAPAMSSPVAPVYSSSAAPVAPVYPSSNATAPVVPSGTGSYTPPAKTSAPPAGYTGAASKASFGVAGLLAAVGLVAAL